MAQGKFKLVKTFFLASGAVLLCLLGWALIVVSRPLPRPPLPNPNGYDDFVKAGRMLTVENLTLQVPLPEQLRGYITTNAAALKLARDALNKQSRVPFEYSSAYATNHIADLAVLKGLALAFTAEARLALMEKRTNDAANIYLDVIRMGHESVRGGAMIDGMVGLACEAVGLMPLQNLIVSLNARQCGELARQLEVVDSRADTAGPFLAQEKVWSRNSFGLKEKLGALLMRGYLKQAAQKFEQKVMLSQIRRRQLLLDLAVRAFELEKGERPKRLEELVPAYLKAIPIDPTTGTNLNPAQ